MIKPCHVPTELQPPLYWGYSQKVEAVGNFYGLHYQAAGAYESTASLVTGAYSGRRERLVELLSFYNDGLGCGSKTKEQIQKLADPRSVAVLTGQQPGLIGGPLYNLYKAMSAVKLAEKLERQLDRPVVPVFWVAGEDHNFTAFNHFWLQSAAGRLVKVRMPLGQDGIPAGWRDLPPEAVADVGQRLRELTVSSEFTEEMLSFLRETGCRSGDPAEWFARILSSLFADLGLVLFDPLLPDAKKLAVPVLSQALSRQEEVEAALLQREKELQSAGCQLQVTRAPGNTLLMLADKRRVAVYKEKNDTFRARNRLLSQAELEGMLRESPQLLGPNVLLRPLVQDTVFPTVAFVAGPSEISYFAQLFPLYKLFSIPSPILVPRTGITIIEPKTARYLQKYGLEGEEALLKLASSEREALERLDQVDVKALFQGLRSSLDEEYIRLGRELGVLDKQLIPLAKKNLQRLFSEVHYLEKKARKEVKKRKKITERHFILLKSTLLPRGQLQERAFNYFSLEAKYGRDLWHQLARCFPAESGHYFFYYLPPGKERVQ